MLQTRPVAVTAERHLYRNRLLDSLPDAAGHVIWLHAPLGYGKSILAAQWADRQEQQGIRIVWATAGGRSVQACVAEALGLPAAAPWGIILEELRFEQSLLVIEDLLGDEELGPLLQSMTTGPLLLASRGPLHEPELLRARTEGRLHELDARQLAFSQDEAHELAERLTFPDWQAHFAETAGWPLLLHFALLTGRTDGAPLEIALRRSVSPEAWQEALFLVAAGTIEPGMATAATLELLHGSFIQELEKHYRMHPLLAERILSRHRQEVQAALEQQLERLSPLAAVRASRSAGHQRLLLQLLERLPLTVIIENPDEFMDLCDETGQPGESGRRLRYAHAQLIRHPRPASLDFLRAALASPAVPALDQFESLVLAATTLARSGLTSEAADMIREAELQLPRPESQEQLLLLVNRALLHGLSGQIAEAVADTENANALSDRLGTANARRLSVTASQNVAAYKFELHGDGATTIRELTGLSGDPALTAERRSQLQFNLAVHHLYQGEEESALRAASLCAASGGPFWRLWSEVLTAHVTRDVAAFEDLYRRARKWELNETNARVGAIWLRTCRFQGDTATASRIESMLPDDGYVHLERALLQHSLGNAALARELLQLATGAYRTREFLQQLHAARFLITGAEKELDLLLQQSTTPEKLVRYVALPLDTIPRSRPELTRGYPLDEVLTSGWHEAIRLRQAELPPLTVSLLGPFSVVHLGQNLRLTARQQQILSYLALGYNRERIAAELWPEASAEKTSNNLNVQLHSLRRTLEPWGQPVYLDDGRLVNADIDVDRLRAALAARDAQTALTLYRGDLLPDSDTPAIEAERANLKRQVLELFIEAAGTAPAETALPLLERALELEPLGEQIAAMLIEALLKLGRAGTARQRLTAFSRRLTEETGLTPSAELLRTLPDRPA